MARNWNLYIYWQKEEKPEEGEKEGEEKKEIKENGAESDRGSLSDDSDDEQNKTGEWSHCIVQNEFQNI